MVPKLVPFEMLGKSLRKPEISDKIPNSSKQLKFDAKNHFTFHKGTLCHLPILKT